MERFFQDSKSIIIASIIKGVEIFDPPRRTCLRPNYSGSGLGYFLLQKHCGCQGRIPGCCAYGWRIILAGSRFLSGAMSRYAPIEGEALAVTWGLEQSWFFTMG